MEREGRVKKSQHLVYVECEQPPYIRPPPGGITMELYNISGKITKGSKKDKIFHV